MELTTNSSFLITLEVIMAMSNVNKSSDRGKLRTVGEVLGGALPYKLALHIKIAEIKERWADVVDSALAARSSPVMFEYEPPGDDVYLLVEAASPAAAQRVKMMSGIISGKLLQLWQIEIIGVRVKVI
ncbi:MAG: DUF721 domain-containing protein [Synergistaceae bacterium]|nr:DUF721 domain-containing protein [Synergistaceae bacterium]